jgi:hypothetical protein
MTRRRLSTVFVVKLRSEMQTSSDEHVAETSEGA